MGKIQLYLSLLLLLSANLPAQVPFQAHTIVGSENRADGARSVYAVDVDGDGDMDVLSASENDDKIAWYENDGQQHFTSHTITTSAVTLIRLCNRYGWGWGYGCALCLMQVMTKSPGTKTTASRISPAISLPQMQIMPNPSMPPMWTGMAIWMCSRPHIMDEKIAWYENDGQQTFTAHTITTSADGAIRLCRRCGWGRGYGCALRISIMMTKSPGTKTMASRPSLPIHHHSADLCQIRLCRRCGRGWGYGCTLGLIR
jgi:ribosomal protein S14